MTTEQDIRNQIAYSRELGKIEGREEGEKDGIKKGREEGIGIGMEKGGIDTAKRMKSEELDAQLISKCAGLSVEQVNAL